jgi:general secretion pathway protein D
VSIAWRRIVGIICVLLLAAGCAAEKLHRDGLAAIDRGEYEAGVALLGRAVSRDPHNMSYRLDWQARRDAALQQLIAQADRARAARELDAAAQSYKRVLAIDPNNVRAQRGLAGLEGDRRHWDAVAQARNDFERKDYDTAEAKLRVVLSEDPGYTPAQELSAAITAARGPVTVAPKLKTRENRKVTLQLRDAPTKMVFEVLQRETGINFILDKDVKSDTKTTIFVQDVPVEEAIDLVLEQNQLARQILSDNMVVIYPNIATKQKEYEQQIVRTFYVSNASAKDVESMLKAVLGTKTLFIDDRAGAVIMRDTPDAVHMAEKLVASLDISEPEVMLEVEVLEISRSRLQDLGINYPTTATLAPTPLGSSGGLVLSDLGHQNSHTITVTALSVTLNAMKQAGVVNTLASPRIRARNKEKAKVHIGSREPVITNTVTTTAGGTTGAFFTGNVQYLDVGLTLDVQPTIYLDGDVSIKVNLEVSSILKQLSLPSGTAYEIGTRNANTLLRLKDGETQILAGLITDSDTRAFNSIPGLGDIPVLGRLFGSKHTDLEKDEIVLSITPRIIRTQARPPGEATEFWYGTETRTRTTPYSATSPTSGPAATSGSAAAGNAPDIAAPKVSSPAGAAAAGATPSMAPGGALPGSGAAAAAGTTAAAPATTSYQGPPVTVPPATLASSAPATPPAGGAAAVAPSALTLEGPSVVKVGDEFQVTVRLATDQSITRLRSQLRFDATALQLLSAETGDLVPAAAGNPKVDTRGGEALLDLTATSDEPVQGSGSLMVLQFKALAPRPAASIQAMLNVVGGSGGAIANSSAPPLKIAVLAGSRQ